MVYLFIAVLWVAVGTLCVKHINSVYARAKEDWVTLHLFFRVLITLVMPIVIPFSTILAKYIKY